MFLVVTPLLCILQFNEEKSVDAGSECSKIIIMLTDGGIEKPEKLIYDNNQGPIKYRIFTYAMGLAPTPLDAVRWLACKNRGE